ncbi:MAG: F0F1 ATP synthase subunit B [Rhodospirillales bacterium]
MDAWAAAGAADHAAEPFYATAEFWVAVAFVIFVAATFRTIYRVVTVALDDRAEKIRTQIEEATRLAEEAQQLLASYERRKHEAVAEAETIVDHARREADRLAERAAEDLERALKRREQLAMDRIAQAEASAVAEVRSRAVDAAMRATEEILAKQLKGKRADALVDAAIKELPDRLH